jgi:hypothetical protein
MEHHDPLGPGDQTWTMTGRAAKLSLKWHVIGTLLAGSTARRIAQETWPNCRQCVSNVENPLVYGWGQCPRPHMSIPEGGTPQRRLERHIRRNVSNVCDGSGSV